MKLSKSITKSILRHLRFRVLEQPPVTLSPGECSRLYLNDVIRAVLLRREEEKREDGSRAETQLAGRAHVQKAGRGRPWRTREPPQWAAAQAPGRRSQGPAVQRPRAGKQGASRSAAQAGAREGALILRQSPTAPFRGHKWIYWNARSTYTLLGNLAACNTPSLYRVRGTVRPFHPSLSRERRFCFGSRNTLELASIWAHATFLPPYFCFSPQPSQSVLLCVCLLVPRKRQDARCHFEPRARTAAAAQKRAPSCARVHSQRQRLPETSSCSACDEIQFAWRVQRAGPI